jgi:hypothetical protein
MYFWLNYIPLSLIKSNLDSLFAALLGTVIVISLTQHSGLGISPDSIYYISAADSFLAGKGFYQFDNKPFVMFPVFYPFVLSGLKLLFGNYLQIAPYFNALLFGITIFFSGEMLEKTNHVKWVKWIVLLLIVLSPSLLEIYTMMWSETLFITEIVIFIWLSKKYFETYQLKHLLIIAVVSAIVANTRLAGVSVIATGGILILMSHDLSWRKKIQHAFIYGLISVSLFVINLLRNATLSHTLTGNRQKGVTPFLENLKYYGLVLSDWLPFSSWTSTFPILLGFVFLIIIGCVIVYRFVRRIEHNSYEKIAAVFTLMYSAFMLIVATISRFETINNRLLSPFYIPFLFTISFYIVGLLKLGFSKIVKFVLKITILLLSFVSISTYAKRYTATYHENNQGGIGGYTDDDWRVSSGLLNHLKSNRDLFKTKQTIYSNAAHAVYLYTHQHVQILPERKYPQLVTEFNENPSPILIWFNNEDNPEVLTLEEVQKTKNLQIISKFNDGVIYQCTSK